MPEPAPARVEELFHRALELAAAERGPMLARECAGDDRLLARVNRLLKFADAGADTTLDRPVFSFGAARPASVQDTPERIGRYRLVRPLGEGGMGTVYEAHQDNPQRTVALKVIRPGLVTRGSLKRFRQEVQVLARLKHPGIAQIYDAGVADQHGRLVDAGSDADQQHGRPFYVMELIEGIPIDQYAARHALGSGERLSLLAQVADAVEHAHQQGVIHRDLKPMNVLVDQVDGVARPRVLDFGVAHVAEPAGVTATLRTGAGELLGTLSYMSPEQAGGDSALVDARADVYSLGVMAYQLLAGRLPLDLSRSPLPEAARQIREEEPSKLGSINTLYRGDIETIVAKALEKEASRRYPSAGAFAEDIRRYLRDEPIIARPAGTLYQLRKFARRNRGLVGGVAAAFVVLVLGLIGTAVLAMEEREQRRVAVAKTAESDRRAYRAGIAAAQAALEHDDLDLASTSLRATPEALRGWEWRHLLARAENPISRVQLRGVEGRKLVPFIAPDGSWIAGVDAGVLRVWSTDSGAVIREVAVPRSDAATLEVSPDAALALLSRNDGAIEMYDVRSGDLQWRFTDRQNASWPATPNTDWTSLVMGVDNNRSVAILDARTASVIRSIPISSVLPAPLFCGADRLAITSATNGFSATMYDLRESRVAWELPGHTFAALCEAAGRVVLLERGTRRGRVSVADLQTAQIFESLEVPEVGSAYHVAIRPDGAVVALEGPRRGVQLRDGATLAPITSVDPGPGRSVIRFTSDGARLIALNDAGTVTQWDAAIGPAPLSLPCFYPVLSACVSHDRTRVLVGDWGSVTCWNSVTGHLEWMRSLSVRSVSAVALSPDGTRAAADAGNGGFCILDTRDGNPVLRSHKAPSPVTALAWFTGPDRIAVGYADGNVELRSATDPGATPEPLASVESGVRSLAVSPDHSRLLVVPQNAPPVLVPPSTDAPIALDTPSRCAVFSGDGTRVASAGADLRIRVHHLGSAEPPVELTLGTPAAILQLAFLGDNRVAAACDDRTIHFWDLDSGDEVGVFHADAVRLMAFDVARDRLLTAGSSDIAAYETAPQPRSVLTAREHATQAHSILRPFLLGDPSRLDRLAANAGPALRASTHATPDAIEAALGVLRARGDHAATLNSEAWKLALPMGNSAEQYAHSLALALRAAELLPDHAGILNTLGTAQVRAGQFEDAVRTFDRCTELRVLDADPPHPADVAMKAIALHALGRVEEARQALEAAVRFSADPRYATDSELPALVREARMRLDAP